MGIAVEKRHRVHVEVRAKRIGPRSFRFWRGMELWDRVIHVTSSFLICDAKRRFRAGDKSEVFEMDFSGSNQADME